MLTEQIILILDSSGLASPEQLYDLGDNSGTYFIKTDKINNAEGIIEKYDPDIIIVYDNFDKDIKEICMEIRNQKSVHRPVIIVVTDKISTESKFEIVQAGADDIQNIDSNEISLRLYAHLRRKEEESLNPVTKLPFPNFTYKIIKRNIEKQNDEIVSLMCLDIDNYTAYKQSYGFIAAEKLLQTFVAIVKTIISKDKDFFGQIGENSFVILTKPKKAEKIANFLSFSFDSVASKFYSSEDVERGYIILSGDDKIGRRIPFVSTSIGIVSNEHNTFNNYQEALNLCRNTQLLARSKSGSYWVSDRPKLSGRKNDIVIKDIKDKVLIMEKDEALSYLLATTFEMKGYNVKTIDKFEETIDNVEKSHPHLIMLDLTEEDFIDELSLCRFIKKEYPEIKVIISTAMRDKQKILDTGVDLYMPKPYDLETLFNWVESFLSQGI